MFLEGNYMFGVLKQNLSVDQAVVMGRTTDPHLDGKTGKIMGISSEGICDFYIIELDEPYPDDPRRGYRAITLTEACICPI